MYKETPSKKAKNPMYDEVRFESFPGESSPGKKSNTSTTNVDE